MDKTLKRFYNPIPRPIRSSSLSELSFKMDHLTRQERSALMSKIRGKNTKPELYIRKYLWNLGYRYRLHQKSLPGTPDIVFPSKRKAVFINGCFWHGHECRKRGIPKTRKAFWRQKVERNQARDAINIGNLTEMGWRTFVLWECEIKKEPALENLLRFLNEGE